MPPAPRKSRVSKRKRQVKGSSVSQQQKKKKAVLLLQRYLRGRRARQIARIKARTVFERVYDDTSGVYFYFNKHTQESTWTKPKVLGNEAFDELPSYVDLDTQADVLQMMAAVWEEQVAADGSTYYYNPGSGESRVEVPEIVSRYRSIAAAAKEELDEDYERVIDPGTGRSIYVNTITGEKVTKKPIRKVEEVEEANELMQSDANSNESNNNDINDVPDSGNVAVQQEKIVAEDLAKELESRLTTCIQEQESILDLSHLWMSSLPKAVLLCNEHLRHASFRGNRFESLPIDIKVLSLLESLDLSGNKYLKAIPVQMWYFTKLRTLDLRDNSISELPRETGNMTTLRDMNLWELAIDTMQSLVNLRLDYNQLEVLPVEIGKLSALQVLTVAHNRLKELPGEMNKLTRLLQLDVSNNKLTSLIPDIEELSSLEDLDACGNQLSALPVLLGHIPSLLKIMVSHNQLTALPDSLTLLGCLELLDLSHNKVVSFPPNFGTKCQGSMYYLNASHNLLEQIEDGVLGLLKLEYLNLSYNKLTSFPGTIRKATNSLQILDVSFNQLESLPNTISKAKVCTTMKLQHNNISELPSDFGLLESLGDLDLSYNRLDKLPDSFSDCKSLVKLNLEHNNITQMCHNFAELERIQILKLSNNKLKEIDSDIGKLVRLRSLDLEHNQLECIPESCRLLKSLREFRLAFNRLTVKPSVLAQLTDLLSVNMGFNEIPDSDCSMQRVAMNLITDGDNSAKSGDLTKAYDQYSSAIEMLSDPDLFVPISEVASSQNQEDSSVKESLRVYIDETRLKRVMVLRRMRKPKLAMKDCNIVISNTDEQSAPAFYLRGCTNMEAQASVDALHDFTKAISLLPGYMLAVKGRARAHYTLGNYMECMDDANFALEEDLFDPDMHTLRGMALMKLGRNQLALHAFKDAVDYCEDDVPIYHAYHYRGLIFWELRRYEDAVREFEFAKKNAKGDSGHIKLARICLSSVLQSMGIVERAAQEYEMNDVEIVERLQSGDLESKEQTLQEIIDTTEHKTTTTAELNETIDKKIQMSESKHGEKMKKHSKRKSEQKLDTDHQNPDARKETSSIVA